MVVSVSCGVSTGILSSSVQSSHVINVTSLQATLESGCAKYCIRAPVSALAAAILSSSLTGQTWALPPARPRSYSESEQSESFISEANISEALDTRYDILTVLRDRWSDDLAGRPHLPSPDHSDKELKERGEEVQDEEDREVEDEEDGDDHIYQTLDRGEPCPVTEPVYALPLKPKLDMKYLSPLLLAYEDRMKEKDALLQTTEEDVKRLRVHVEEVIHENERLHNEIAKLGGVGQKDCHQIQKQAFLVLQENQVLIDQLEAQHVKAKANHSRHHSEVSKVSKQLMLLEAENQRLQEDLEESRREAQKNTRQIQDLQARLKNAITWDEHCNIAGKLRGQLEQQENGNKRATDELLLRVSSLQEGNRRLAQDKANVTADVKRLEAELQLSRQANRKAERRMSFLERQKDECVLEEGKTRHYLGAVISLAQHISQERDQLLYTVLLTQQNHFLFFMASGLQQEKHGFVNRILNGTVRFGKLQEDVKNHTTHQPQVNREEFTSLKIMISSDSGGSVPLLLLALLVIEPMDLW
ncbi:hypothetical protein F2P81_004894 [Scophthalmus maximus]|uniref:Uncharacterized protein n=1 Tax=Scophthalmus maximus TaxID=52904 RepID=A0A6A4TAR2_SCOMX|nr:hypothetical protein F2P81_004894 [Scophthalmus maximus]